MRYGSVCSGIEGFGRGLERAGLGPARWFCEASAFRRRVLERHWPGVPCHHDLTTLDPAQLEPVDVFVGGTPCPDFSHAKADRQGLDGSKSRLFWDFARIRNAIEPEWTVWENVDGALTTNQGLDFALVLGAFVGADINVPARGWPSAGLVAGPWGGACWRVLDAQHFGTPQRRHRLFVVGRLGGPCPTEVLLEPARGSRDPATREPAPQELARSLGERVAGTLGAYPGRGGVSRSQVVDGHGAYVAAGEPVVTAFRKAQKAHHGEDAERWEEAAVAGALSAGGGDANATVVTTFNIATGEGGTAIGAREADTARALLSDGSACDPGTVVIAHDVASTLTAYTAGSSWADVDDYNIVAYALRSNGSNARAAAHETEVASALLAAGAKAGGGTTEETLVAFAPVASTLTAEQGRGQRFPFGQEDGQLVASVRGIRRLTPTECERLQGVPDGWTIPWGPSLRDAPAWHQLSADERAALPVPYDPPLRLDTPRRSACGDAVNAAVSEWIGRRLLEAAA